MAGNKKPRIDRNKNPLHRFSALNRLMGASIAKQPMTEAEIGQLEMAVLTAVESIARGHGTGDNWDAIAKAINQAWIFATEAGTGEEAKPYLLVAQQGMERMKKRFLETGKMAFDGLALEAVRRAIELWREQLAMSTLGELSAATDVVRKHFYRKEAA
ncbi:MAG TPA: hypothetical protein VF783_13985 [Terriglobales bacterium]